MIRKDNVIVIFISLIASVVIFFVRFDKQKRKNTSFEALIFKVPDGWGYDILVNDSLFIHQESVPATNGKKGFPKKELAERTAELIINKMKTGRPPTVTTFELDKIFSLTDMSHESLGKIK